MSYSIEIREEELKALGKDFFIKLVRTMVPKVKDLKAGYVIIGDKIKNLFWESIQTTDGPIKLETIKEEGCEDLGVYYTPYTSSTDFLVGASITGIESSQYVYAPYMCHERTEEEQKAYKAKLRAEGKLKKTIPGKEYLFNSNIEGKDE